MLFQSKGKELRLVKKSATYKTDMDGHLIKVPGEAVEFINHFFRTEDPDLIDWLLKHPSRGIEFDVVPEEVFEYAKKNKDQIISQEKPEPISLVNTNEVVEEAVSKAVETIMGKLKPILESYDATMKRYESFIQRPKKYWWCDECHQKFTSPIMLARHRKNTGHRKLEDLKKTQENSKENTEDVEDKEE